MKLKVIAKRHASPKGFVFWFHGLGATAHDFFDVPEMFEKTPPLSYVFPSAPIIPITINGGYPMPGWYDILSADFKERSVDVEGLKKVTKAIHQLLEEEHQNGVEYSQMTLIGFSQGGSVALDAALSFPHRLNSVVVLSGYLPRHNVEDYAHIENATTPILWLHGSLDAVVPPELAQASCKTLRQHHYNITYETEKIAHTVSNSGIRRIDNWLTSCHG